MRLERMSNEKFKIFLTFDDLIERGLTKEDLWHDLPRVHQLFSDMMYEASDELGFELDGTLLVQVYLLQAQGMFIVVTQTESDLDEEDEDYIEMKVTLDESKELIFSFCEFEDIIQVSHSLYNLGVRGGCVDYYQDLYYMRLEEEDIETMDKEYIIALMSEFGTPSIITSYRLDEYGKTILAKQAVNQIHHYFIQPELEN
ncbi:genetic competence negative regulator [Thalassobacillus pellis]|uniref:genetic competence negative regulator n=1 Tax=Thalassobacillus pellis TaxID=748008 RepID=UPI0019612AF5|nr:genetic competence negative regulator [Thalassobacillus pellis]MBM7552438.1 adapter protein MecA 1/2 [Thalassobacillus pellis]